MSAAISSTARVCAPVGGQGSPARTRARKAPLPEFKALPSPKASPEVVAEQLARLAPLKKIMTRPGDKAWAPQIIARHEGGEQISPTVLKFAQAVAGVKA